MHGPVRAAESAGTAQVVITLDSWPEGKVRSTTHEVVVLPPRKGPKPEPITRRLVRTLPHPDRKATLGAVRFHPDGTRLLVAGYPSGIVQVWDTKAWKEVARLDTPSGLRGSWDYAQPTPDGKTILVHVLTRKLVRQEKDGKVQERVQIDGRIDRYDLATGKRIGAIPLKDRGPQQLFLVPGGKAVVLNTEGSFTATGDRPQFSEWLDLSASTTKKLFDASVQPAFAADGKTAYLVTTRYQRDGTFDNALVKYDLVAGKVVKTKERPDKHTYFASPVLSPDGKRLYVATGRMIQFKSEGLALAVLDADTLEERARLPAPEKADAAAQFDLPRFSADGKIMVTRCGGPLIVWDTVANRVMRTVPVGDIHFARLALRPDGKRAVVAGLPQFDFRSVGRFPDPQDLPQPRVLLIDLTDPKSTPEVLMLPNGSFGGLAFSPDGKTLAFGSSGGVHLLDVSARAK